MLFRLTSLRLSLTILLFLFSGSALATNGLVFHGHSVRARGMGGVGVAIPHDALSVLTNPALSVRVGTDRTYAFTILRTSSSFDASELAYPYSADYQVHPGSYSNDISPTYVVAVGFNSLATEKTAWGAHLELNSDMGTDYNAEVYPYPSGYTIRTDPTGVQHQKATLAASIAHDFGHSHFLGISAQFIVQRFRTLGLHRLRHGSEDFDHVTNKGYDQSYGLNLKFGYFGKLSSRLSLGASYQLKQKMSEFDAYAGFLPDQGKLDLPAELVVGAAYKLNDRLTIGLDVQDIFYSNTSGFGNPMLETQEYGMYPLWGASDGRGFGWDDIVTIKLGCEWIGSETNTFRIGYSYSDQPIDKNEVYINVLLPYIIQHHLTFGQTHLYGCGHELTYSLAVAISGGVDGPNAMRDPPLQTIELNMSQLEFGIAFSF